MGIIEVSLIGVALAMDACVVAMTNGMTDSKMSVWKALLIAVFFGVFQFLMPIIGYYITGVIADAFLSVFQRISAWISFGLLAFLGGKMLFETIREKVQAKKGEVETVATGKEKLSIGKLTLQAIATSIDALAIGVTLQMAAITEGLALGAWGSTLLIGVITLFLAFGAVYIGKAVGVKLADKAGIVGGVVLLGIGLKILIESFL